MELIDLINHVKANVEAGKLPHHGLLYEGRPALAVALSMPDKYSLKKSAGEKLRDEFSHRYPTVEWSLLNNAEREYWQWLAEREQTLKAQADAWEAVWDKLMKVCKTGFSLEHTGKEIALQIIDDLVAGQKRQSMTGEQFYNEIWKGHFEHTMSWKSLNPEFKSACETGARLISPRKLTGQDVKDAVKFTNHQGCSMVDYWDRVAEILNAK